MTNYVTTKQYNMKYRLLLLAAMVMIAVSTVSAFELSHYATNSKLATGKWVKIKIGESGIYQITDKQARDWGFSGVAALHVFGRGGEHISERLTDDIVDDLPQLPVVRTDDGRLLFYGAGTTMYESNTGLQHAPVQNTYTTNAYYFITDDSRFTDIDITRATAVEPNDNVITSFTEHLYHEQELTNTGETGRTFLGEDFRSTNTRTFDFTLEGIVDGSTVKVLTSFAAKMPNSGATLSFKYNGNTLPQSNSDRISPVSDNAHDHYKMAKSLKSFELPGTNRLNYSITFTPTGTVTMARLDFVAVNYERALDITGRGQLPFRIQPGLSQSQFRVTTDTDNLQVWNVTTAHAPVMQNLTVKDGVAQFSPVYSVSQNFIAFNPAKQFASPTYDRLVDNQDIHGMAVPDMIIITPIEYRDQAKRIADMHARVDGFITHVITDEQVYNEFAAGTPDAMAYRMISKYFYDRGEQEGHKFGYLLLMGNGSWDNRGISNEFKNIAYPKLLTWQTRYSDDENQSYTSDDPFTILGDGSGPNFYRETPCIAIGRLPAKSEAEARTLVNKLVNYVTKPDYGSWKNNVLNVADDGDNAVHMIQAEDVITTAKANGGNDFIFNRVYLDATTQATDGAGNKYPEARNKMYTTARDGVSWWNYTGHSGIYTWTGDGLMKRPDIQNELYDKHLPILYAATCEFTRFDAIELSGGEMMMLNNAGGAIAVICPPRLALVYSNGPLNAAVAKYIFARDAKGLPMRLGDIMLRGKIDYPGDDNTMRYFLFGDPAMRPAYPTYKAVIDKINNDDATSGDPTVLKARQSVTFTGHIEDLEGNPANNFNGHVLSTLFDCETSVVSHGYGDKGAEFVFNERSNKLAFNNNEVRDGKFTILTIIPSEVIASYDNYQPSLISLYAYDPTDSIDANGSCDHFYIYGYDDTVEDDGKGPDIFYLRLNNEDFKDGDQVGDSPLVQALVGDDSGINFSSAGIGHVMTLTLDDKTTYSDVVNYYTSDETPIGGSEGYISYPLSGLSEGPHTLKLKVWDVFANSSEKTISFSVVKGLKPDIVNVYCDACPASTETNFYVKHNLINANMTVTIEVLDLLGRIVWSTTQSGRSNGDTTFPVNWNLNDRSGNRVSRGIYIYRATISTDGIRQTTKSKKLAVTAQ